MSEHRHKISHCESVYLSRKIFKCLNAAPCRWKNSKKNQFLKNGTVILHEEVLATFSLREREFLPW